MWPRAHTNASAIPLPEPRSGRALCYLRVGGGAAWKMRELGASLSRSPRVSAEGSCRAGHSGIGPVWFESRARNHRSRSGRWKTGKLDALVPHLVPAFSTKRKLPSQGSSGRSRVQVSPLSASQRPLGYELFSNRDGSHVATNNFCPVAHAKPSAPEPRAQPSDPAPASPVHSTSVKRRGASPIDRGWQKPSRAGCERRGRAQLSYCGCANGS